MIKLTETEKVFILVIKGHFSNYLNNNDKWEEFLEPVYRSLYGTYEWDTYRNYELTLFRILFNLYWKIKEGEPDKGVIVGVIELDSVRSRRVTVVPDFPIREQVAARIAPASR